MGSLLGRAELGAPVVPPEGYRSSVILEEAVLTLMGKKYSSVQGKGDPGHRGGKVSRAIAWANMETL